MKKSNNKNVLSTTKIYNSKFKPKSLTWRKKRNISLGRGGSGRQAQITIEGPESPGEDRDGSEGEDGGPQLPGEDEDGGPDGCPESSGGDEGGGPESSGGKKGSRHRGKET